MLIDKAMAALDTQLNSLGSGCVSISLIHLHQLLRLLMMTTP